MLSSVGARRKAGQCKLIAMCATRLSLMLLSAAALFAQTARRPFKLDDLARMREVRDPQCSPDGKWVAYAVSQIAVKEDRSDGHVWMASYDGATNRQVTSSQESESAPRWSPDGKYLSFTSSRPGKARGSQVWLLDRNGGEAMQLTEIKGRLQGHEWSPDSKRLALIVGDPDPEAEPAPSPQPGATATPRVPKPIVIDRYRFKQDVQGYLLSGRHSYIYLFDVATKKLDRVTSSKFDEGPIAWSPDGNRIAFFSNHADDPDRDPAAQLYVVDAKAGSTEKQLTLPEVRAGRSRPEWSPDGKWLAFFEGDEKKFGAYSMDHLMLVASDGSSPAARFKATEALDRGVSTARFSPDGRTITFLVTDDRSVYPARANVSSGSVEKLMKPPVVLNSWNTVAGHTIVLSGGDSKAGEFYAFENAAFRQINNQNDALIAELDLGVTEDVEFKSKDGTEVHGLLTYPVGYVKGTKGPRPPPRSPGRT